MPTIDLARAALRELNGALHKLPSDTEETHWSVLNPRGLHSVAAGIDAPEAVLLANIGCRHALTDGCAKRLRLAAEGGRGAGRLRCASAR